MSRKATRLEVLIKKDDELDWLSLLPAFSSPDPGQPADITVLTAHLAEIEVINHDDQDTEIQMWVILWDSGAHRETAPRDIQERELVGPRRLRARSRANYRLKFTAVFGSSIPREGRTQRLMLRVTAIGLGEQLIPLEELP